MRMIFAVAASILIVVGVTTWAVPCQNNEHLARAVVDLRDRSMARGTEPPPKRGSAGDSPQGISFGNLSSVGQRRGYFRTQGHNSSKRSTRLRGWKRTTRTWCNCVAPRSENAVASYRQIRATNS